MVYRQLAIILSLLGGISGCEDEPSDPPPMLSPDQEVIAECVVTSGDCPNACVNGIGILGESCADSASCQCGLFCDEGRCQPYEGEYRGCFCKDGRRAPLPDPELPFTERCQDQPDGSPCDDQNECTEGDQCDAGVCQGTPTSIAKACDDGNSCTSGDLCAGAVCQGVDKADGASCDDGNVCTEGDQCRAGACEGAALDCGNLGDQCNVGICDPLSGACVAQPRPTGEPCDDRNYCTLGDFCEAGVCVANERISCADQEDQCLSATCDPLSGSCQLIPREDGIFCDTDQSLCTAESCRSGRCVVDREVDCQQLCRTGACDPRTGLCEGDLLPDGTACDDGDACTETAGCYGGVCLVTELLCACDQRAEGDLCDDNNPCTRVSRCDADGRCGAEDSRVEFEPAGTPCDADQNLCTQGGQCDGAGVCAGEAPISCDDPELIAQLGACQVLTCRPESGECLPSSAPNGQECDPRRSCFTGVCSQGICQSEPVSCPPSHNPCSENLCNPEAADLENPCEEVYFPENLPCQDQDICTGSTRCLPVAAGATETQCTSSLDPSVNLCDACSDKSEGETCEDGDLCTENKRCQLRGVTLVCVGDPIVCDTNEDQPACTSQVCNPTSGQCEDVSLPIGTPCDDGDTCTRRDQCTVGENSALSCTGAELLREDEGLNCPAGGSPLLGTEFGSVDMCEDPALGAQLLNAEALNFDDQNQLKILGDLTPERPVDWMTIEVDEPQEDRRYLIARLSDRCNLPIAAPQVVQIQIYRGQDEVASAPLFSGVGDQDEVEIKLPIPRQGVYAIKVSALTLTQERLPYVLHLERSAQRACALSDNLEESVLCCPDEVCVPNPDFNEGLPEHICSANAPFEEEPNDGAMTSTRLRFLGADRTRIIGELASAYDQDVYKVRLAANHTYEVKTKSYCGSLLDTRLSVLSDPDFEVLLTNNDRSDEVAPLERLYSRLANVSVPSEQDVYVKVSAQPIGGAEPFGHYQLLIRDVTCDPTADNVEVCACPDQRCLVVQDDLGRCGPINSEREPNQSAEEALTAANDLSLETRMVGRIDRVGDVDTYWIDLPAGRFAIHTHSYCEQQALNTSLRVRTSAGLMVARDDDSGAGRLADIGELVVSQRQRHLIEVSAEGGGVGSYVLEVEVLGLGSGPEEETRECVVDTDCGCQELKCEVNENPAEDEPARSCVPRNPEDEPNNTLAQAQTLVIGERRMGEVSSLTDLDLYRVQITPEQVNLRFDLKLESPCGLEGLNGHLRLRTALGELIEESTYAQGIVGIFDWVPRASGEVIIEVSGALASRGEYVLSVNERAGGAYIPISERTCQVDSDCRCSTLYCDSTFGNLGSCIPRAGAEIEPNDDAVQARRINRDANGVGVIAASLMGDAAQGAGDRDYFLLEIGEDEVWRDLKITVDNLCDQPDPPRAQVSIYAPNGALLRSVTGDPSPELLWWRPTQRGSHLIKVEQLDRDGDYLLKVEEHARCSVDAPRSDDEVALDLTACGCPERVCLGAEAGATPERVATMGPELRSASSECYADVSQLSLESEPNDATSLANYVCLNTTGACDISHINLQGQLMSAGDVDHFRLPDWTTELQGALFDVELRPYCRDASLPLRVEVVRDQVEWVFAQGAQGRTLGVGELADEAMLSSTERSQARVTTPGSYVVRVQRDLTYTESAPITGGYVVTLNEVSCEADADCLCDQVECARGWCRALNREIEPNDTQARAQNVAPIDDLTDLPLTESHTGSLSDAPHPALDTDYYLIDLSSVELNDQSIPLEVTIDPFCEAATPDYEISIQREIGAIGSGEYVIEPLDFNSVAGSDVYRVMISESARYWVKLRALNERGGAYSISFELRSPE